jgi:exonuclease SbcC
VGLVLPSGQTRCAHGGHHKSSPIARRCAAPGQACWHAGIWQRLDSLIGSAKGDKFRTFAQGLTLDHLLQLANRHLARLHGRYLLRRKPTGELELDIVDAWQGDTTRDTLEMALTALDSVNASGKMIGIISHVEALKERTPHRSGWIRASGLGTRGWWCSSKHKQKNPL